MIKLDLMKIALCILVFFVSSLMLASDTTNSFGFCGNVDYTQQKSQQLINVIGNDFRVKIFEPSNKKYMWFFGGSIEHNYNVFQRSYYINSFGQLGFEF